MAGRASCEKYDDFVVSAGDGDLMVRYDWFQKKMMGDDGCDLFGLGLVPGNHGSSQPIQMI